MTTQPETEQLTPKELEVLNLMLNPELDRADIAQKMFITRYTVCTHILSIFSKLHVSSRFEAICKYAKMDESFRQALIEMISKEAA